MLVLWCLNKTKTARLLSFCPALLTLPTLASGLPCCDVTDSTTNLYSCPALPGGESTQITLGSIHTLDATSIHTHPGGKAFTTGRRYPAPPAHARRCRYPAPLRAVERGKFESGSTLYSGGMSAAGVQRACCAGEKGGYPRTFQGVNPPLIMQTTTQSRQRLPPPPPPRVERPAGAVGRVAYASIEGAAGGVWRVFPVACLSRAFHTRVTRGHPARLWCIAYPLGSPAIEPL